MRKLAILTFQTLDGVMQAPSSPDEDRSNGFPHGGWAAPYWSAVMEQVMREAMAEPYDIVFGRKTYETFAGHWTAAPEDDPVSAIMNGSRKYVVTNSLKTLSWAHSKIVSGDAVEAVAALKFEDGPLLQVHGSWDLIQTLLRADLIDEFRIWTFPVVVGPGKRLFEAAPQRTLSLIKSEPCSNGVLMQVFRRDGAI